MKSSCERETIFFNIGTFKRYRLKLRHLPIYLQVTYTELIVVSNHLKIALYPMYTNMIMPVYYTMPVYYRSTEVQRIQMIRKLQRSVRIKRLSSGLYFQ